ncbi:endonuclease/exonuclease/phosphatase family protein [Phycisphaeraceae bacterium D3-23]
MSQPIDEDKAGNAKRKRRWVWRGLLLVVVFVAGWYVIARATDAGRRVRLVETSASMPGSSAAPVWEEDEALTVAAYNIAHARGLAVTNWAGDRNDRLTEIAALIASWDADIVVLNEVDLDASWSGRVNQARVIAERAGFVYRVEQANYDLSLPGFRLRFGNAVLSRHPIVDAHPIDYPAVSGLESLAFGQKRGVVCTVDVGGGRRVRVVAVHWDSRDAAVRAGSADVLTHLAADGGPPIIAAGDFNAPLVTALGLTRPPEESAAERLVTQTDLAWIVPTAHEPVPDSFPSAAPAKLIDYILAQPPLRVARFEVVDSQLSDHRPVLAELLWATETAENDAPSPAE